MKKNWKLMLTALMMTAVISGGVVAFAASTAGSSDDPLVTLSYLNDVFTATVNSKVDTAVKNNEETLKTAFNTAIETWSQEIKRLIGSSGTGSSASFTVVTLSKGQTLTGKVGCEVMLRVGSAVCVAAEAPGLIDTTDGTTLVGGGSLQTNHLYMVTVDTRGVKAASDTVKVLARGSYSIA